MTANPEHRIHQLFYAGVPALVEALDPNLAMTTTETLWTGTKCVFEVKKKLQP
jgi:hypothetical protein